MATTTLAQVSHNGKPSTISTVTDLLSKNFNAIKSCLPKHLTAERMCRIAVQFMQSSKNTNLLQCNAASLVNCVIEAASLGLEIDSRGLAYLVPYGKEAKLIFGYKGLMELAYRSGRVTNIYAETVCENDEFVFELGLCPKLEHRPNLDDRGALRAVYAVARLKDADPIFVVLGKQDVEKIKRASKASNSGPWQTWEEEMWKKTAIRRLCKYLPLSPEVSRAIAMDEATDAGIKPQYLAEGLIDLPEENFIEVNASSNQEAEKVSIPNPSPKKKKIESSVIETSPIEPQDNSQIHLEPDDIICPKSRTDGKPNIVDKLSCESCKERNGCPSWENQ